MRQRSGPLVVLALGVATVLSGCGTTVQGSAGASGASAGMSNALSGSVAAPGSGGAGVGPDGTDVAQLGGTESGDIPAGVSTSARSTGSAGSDTAASDSGSGGSADVATGSLPVSSKAPLLIGVELEKNAATTRAAFGVQSEGDTNNEDVYRAIARWLNDRGGIGGRKVELAFHLTDLNSGTFDAQAQATCEAFTHDQRAFAVVTAVNRSQLLPVCLAKAGVPLFWYRVEQIFTPEQMADLRDFLYLPFQVGFPRGAVLVDALHEQGFFAKGSKIGLMTLDHPTFRAYVDRIIKPRLRTYGLQATDEQYIYLPSELSGLSQSASSISSAVLKFRSEGIDRVLFADTAGVGPFFFLPQADSQNYHPKYGIGSWEYPQTFVQTAPEAQLVNVSGLTWSPTWDLAPPQYATQNRAQAQCLQIVRAAGVTQLAGDRPCDAFFLMRDALAGKPAATPTDLRHGVEALGSRYESQYVYRSMFAPGRLDGAGGYRQLRYEVGCHCFTNVGAVRPIG
jgi:hypothetical protein